METQAPGTRTAYKGGGDIIVLVTPIPDTENVRVQPMCTYEYVAILREDHGGLVSDEELSSLIANLPPVTDEIMKALAA